MLTPRMIGTASSSRLPTSRSAGEASSRGRSDPRGPAAGTRVRAPAVTAAPIQTSSQMIPAFTTIGGIFVVSPGPWTPRSPRLAGANASPNGA